MNHEYESKESYKKKDHRLHKNYNCFQHQHIRRIMRHWRLDDAENSGINYILKSITIGKIYCNTISQYSSFYYIFDQMNASLEIIRDYFDVKILPTPYELFQYPFSVFF